MEQKKRRQQVVNIGVSTLGTVGDKIKEIKITLQEYIEFGWRIDIVTPITSDGIQYIMSIETEEE